MENRFYRFEVDNNKYIFDGNSVTIFEDNENIDNISTVSLNAINAHRSNFLKTICLVLNNSCNLVCEYCFANKGVYNKPKAQMSLQSAKNAIALVVDSVKKNNSNQITIAFFGGEPLLSFNFIEQIISYISSNYKDIRVKYKITTNGTLITKEIADYFIKHDFDIMLSIDGTKKLHDYYRKDKLGQGSYDKIVNNIKFFSDKKSLNSRITITDINPEIHTYVDSIIKLGIERITFAIDYNISKEAFEKYIISLKLLFKKYYDDIRLKKYYDITNISSVIASLALHNRFRAHCNAGISYLTLSADGKYYRCPRFVGKEKFCLGNNTDKENILFSVEEFKNILKASAIDRNEDCAKCTFVYLCGGMCFHHAYISEKSQFNNVSIECIQRKIIFTESIKLLCRLSINERRDLLLYLTSIWEANFREEVNDNVYS